MAARTPSVYFLFISLHIVIPPSSLQNAPLWGFFLTKLVESTDQLAENNFQPPTNDVSLSYLFTKSLGL